MLKKDTKAKPKRYYHHLWDSTLKENLQFPQITDASPDPFLITDKNANIYYVNPSWEKLTGYRFEEVKGKNPRFLQSGRTPKKVHKQLWKNLLRGKAFTTREMVNRKKNGEEFQVHAIYFPIRKREKYIFYVQTFHDITRMVKIEKQKDAFIGIASHELKTPITTLYVYSQILEKRLADKKEEKNLYLLRNIMRETKRLSGLIEDLLNVSRLESGKMTFQPERFDLNALVQQVVADFQYTTETHEIKKDGEVNGDVVADKQRIEQVLINLITNAIKYSPKSNKIIVRIFNKRNKAIVTVEDFGFGIAQIDIPHIFERFYRTKEKDEGKITGFGLGLYISKEIIKKNKGKIWVESEKGKGSTFYFSLPLAK